jgi:hypothetical protein
MMCKFKKRDIMKTTHILIFTSILFTSCRTQKYDSGYQEELEQQKTHPIVEKKETPCINKMYCDRAMEIAIENYYKTNVFLVQVIETGFQYRLCLDPNSNFSIDTTSEFILDTLQYHCPID